MNYQEEELLKWRKEFPILEKYTYLISNSLGAMPGSVYNSMKEYADIWANRGVQAWEDEWWELSLKVGNLIAPLIGSGEDEISMHTNISPDKAKPRQQAEMYSPSASYAPPVAGRRACHLGIDAPAPCRNSRWIP